MSEKHRKGYDPRSSREDGGILEKATEQTRFLYTLRTAQDREADRQQKIAALYEEPAEDFTDDGFEDDGFEDPLDDDSFDPDDPEF